MSERKGPEDRQDREGPTPQEREDLLKLRRRLHEIRAKGDSDDEDGE